MLCQFQSGFDALDTCFQPVKASRNTGIISGHAGGKTRHLLLKGRNPHFYFAYIFPDAIYLCIQTAQID